MQERSGSPVKSHKDEAGVRRGRFCVACLSGVGSLFVVPACVQQCCIAFVVDADALATAILPLVITLLLPQFVYNNVGERTSRQCQKVRAVDSTADIAAF